MMDRKRRAEERRAEKERSEERSSAEAAEMAALTAEASTEAAPVTAGGTGGGGGSGSPSDVTATEQAVAQKAAAAVAMTSARGDSLVASGSARRDAGGYAGMYLASGGMAQAQADQEKLAIERASVERARLQAELAAVEAERRAAAEARRLAAVDLEKKRRRAVEEADRKRRQKEKEAAEAELAAREEAEAAEAVEAAEAEAAAVAAAEAAKKAAAESAAASGSASNDFDPALAATADVDGTADRKAAEAAEGAARMGGLPGDPRAAEPPRASGAATPCSAGIYCAEHLPAGNVLREISMDWRLGWPAAADALLAEATRRNRFKFEDVAKELRAHLRACAWRQAQGEQVEWAVPARLVTADQCRLRWAHLDRMLCLGERL